MSADDRIAEIRARLAAATPGPWVMYTRRESGHRTWSMSFVVHPSVGHVADDIERPADAALIAAAPADLDYLLALVDAADATWLAASADLVMAERARIVARLRARATSEEAAAERDRAEVRVGIGAWFADAKAEVLRDMAHEIEREGQG